MTTARLPGIYFETVAPPAPALLPRMDIAAFAGFLPSGPIGVPFVVEDSTRFEEIFGTDQTLAWDPAAHQLLMAQTPPSVRTFFRNGGTRCWVLRLANNAVANQWTIPGLLQVDSAGKFQAGWVQARSEGSWTDDLTVNATLLESPLPQKSLISGATPEVTGLSPGDTVQLYYQATQTWGYHTCSNSAWYWFKAVQPGDIGACGPVPPPQPDAVTMLGPGVCTPLQFSSFCCQTSGSQLEMQLVLSRDAALTVQPGSWLRIELGGRTLLMQVESLEAAGSIFASSPPTPAMAMLVSSLGWWALDSDAAWAANKSGTAQVTVVEFELWAMPLDSPTLRIADLGFAPDHLRYWNLLPTDVALYAPVTQPAPLPYAALSADIDHPRFPLAGSPATAIGFPLGMTTLVNSDFSQAANMPGGTALSRDGLAAFNSALFVDPLLQGSNSTTLLQNAFAMQYGAQTPRQPGGIYALLSIEEASMLAVPDATWNGWSQTLPPGPPLAPPDPLQVSEPDAEGNYTVSWTAVTGASGYLVQGSTDPSFQTGVNPQDAGGATSIALRGSPECAEQLYYRVQAYGSAGQSPWSETGSVLLGTGDFFACNQAPLLAPQLLLFQEPNRILLDWIPAPGGYDGFTLQIGSDPLFVSPTTLYQGMELGFEYWISPGPPSYFRVSAQLGGASSPWSNTVSSTPEPLSAWTAMQPATPSGPAPVSGGPILVAVHTAMLQIAAARGDMVAILSLPVSFRTQDAAAYPAQLGAAIASAEPGRTLSYGALYHPWLVVRDSTAPLPLSLRTVPPDGGVCGLIAKTTLSSGAWIAAANVALQNVLDLQPAMTPDAWTVFDQNQVNLISQQPEGFLVMGQDTLVTVETDLVPLNVRRLLILIRRLALREGVRYVFRNMTSTFVRQVTRQWDGWMQQMLARGAFAGLSAADSYRIIADGSVNTPVSIAQSQFIVELQVAPSVPMRFLTVQLVQSGGQLTLSES